MKKQVLVAAAAALLAAGSAIAASPTYTYSVAPSGSYPDTGGTELTDGQIGQAGWQNLTSRWVGWDFKPTVHIDFDFGSLHNVTQVSVGSTQDSTFGLIALPNVTVSSWNGSSWVQQGQLLTAFNVANDKSSTSTDPHAWLTVSGLNFDSQLVRVTLDANGQGAPNNQKWTFADEVQFQVTAVPEPSAYALALAGLGLLGVVARRRRGG